MSRLDRKQISKTKDWPLLIVTYEEIDSDLKSLFLSAKKLRKIVL